MKRFGGYLVRAGVLKPEELALIRRRQAERRKPIGKLALERGLLKLRQVHWILAEQAERGGRFGEIAVSLGLLTRHDVEVLLQAQQDERPRLGTLLLELGVMTDEELARVIREYHRDRGSAEVVHRLSGGMDVTRIVDCIDDGVEWDRSAPWVRGYLVD